MTQTAAKVYNIPAGLPFLDLLARGLWRQAGEDPLALSAMTVLLPTRRACRSLADAFLRLTDGGRWCCRACGRWAKSTKRKW